MEKRERKRMAVFSVGLFECGNLERREKRETGGKWIGTLRGREKRYSEKAGRVRGEFTL